MLKFGPTTYNHAASKNCVDNAVDESKSVGNKENNDFNNKSFSNVSQNTPNSELIVGIHIASNCYDGSFLNNKNRHDISTILKNDDNEFYKNQLMNSDSVTFDRNPTPDEEVSIKKNCS